MNQIAHEKLRKQKIGREYRLMCCTGEEHEARLAKETDLFTTRMKSGYREAGQEA